MSNLKVLKTYQRFSTFGISFDGIHKFITEVCRGEEALAGKTVEQVKTEFLLPFITSHQKSYVAIEKETQEANVYLIYTWKDLFLDVIYSLRRALNKSPDAVVWWDFFCLNQTMLPEISFSYLGEITRSMVEVVDRVVLCIGSGILRSANSTAPFLPLQRTWCIWELFCVHDAKKQLEVAMHGSCRVLDALESIDKRFASMRLTTSESTQFGDKAQVLDVASATVGIAAVEERVLLLLRTWLIRQHGIELGQSRRDTSHKAKCLQEVVRFCLRRGLHADAEAGARALVSMFSARFGSASLRALGSLLRLGAVLEACGNHMQALHAYTEAYAGLKETLGRDHKSCLQALERLATLSEMLNVPQAQYYNDELKQARKESSPRSPKSLSPGKSKLAAQLDISKMLSSKDDEDDDDDGTEVNKHGQDELVEDQELDRLDRLLTMGTQCDKEGKLEEAESLLSAALDIQKRRFGVLDAEVLATQHTLGAIAETAGRTEEARATYEQCLQLKLKLLGEADPSTLLTMHSLALLQKKAGNLNEAEKLLRDCVSNWRKVQEQDGVEIDEEALIVQGDYATVVTLQGKFEEAVRCRRELLTLRKRQHRLSGLVLAEEEGELDPELVIAWERPQLDAMDDLAQVLEKCGELDEAESLYFECWERKQLRLGNAHVSTLRTVLHLGMLYKSKGKFEEARRMLATSYDVHRKTFGERHPSSLAALQVLGQLYEDRNMHSEAVAIFEQCEAILSSEFGLRHPDTVQCQQRLRKLKSSSPVKSASGKGTVAAAVGSPPVQGCCNIC